MVLESKSFFRGGQVSIYSSCGEWQNGSFTVEVLLMGLPNSWPRGAPGQDPKGSVKACLCLPGPGLVGYVRAHPRNHIIWIINLIISITFPLLLQLLVKVALLLVLEI